MFLFLCDNLHLFDIDSAERKKKNCAFWIWDRGHCSTWAEIWRPTLRRVMLCVKNKSTVKIKGDAEAVVLTVQHLKLSNLMFFPCISVFLFFIYWLQSCSCPVLLPAYFVVRVAYVEAGLVFICAYQEDWAVNVHGQFTNCYSKSESQMEIWEYTVFSFSL